MEDSRYHNTIPFILVEIALVIGYGWAVRARVYASVLLIIQFFRLRDVDASEPYCERFARGHFPGHGEYAVCFGAGCEMWAQCCFGGCVAAVGGCGGGGLAFYDFCSVCWG